MEPILIFQKHKLVVLFWYLIFYSLHIFCLEIHLQILITHFEIINMIILRQKNITIDKIGNINKNMDRVVCTEKTRQSESQWPQMFTRLKFKKRKKNLVK